MRKIILLSVLSIISFLSYSQDQTNKGKDFWIPYPEHIDGTNSAMGVYITSDVASTGVITVGAVTIPFTVIPNTVVYKFLGPNGGGDAPNTGVYLGGYQDNVVSGRGIHVTATSPVVVFAHIIRSARSGATLVLPTKVWGKEYIVPSFANSGSSASIPEINVYASKPNTVIEITPTVSSRNGLHAPGVPFQVTIPNVGDVYQLQFSQNSDPSGTLVKSVASGTGCNQIAVFSATTWSGINCNNASGGDNLYQQLFPAGSWGKQFLTGPLKKVATNAADNNVDIIRVFVKDPTTVITKTDNGVTTTLTGLTASNYYQYTASKPTLLQADKPIQVIQYVTSQNCGSPQTNSDPEMIALSAVEQTINDITVFSAHTSYVPPGQSQVTNHYINVIMKTANTSLFKINGVAPNAVFTAIPGTIYSYLKEDVTAKAATNPVFRLSADSGFIAIAYGFGNVESYGYNAGTNVKDLYQQIGVNTEYGIDPTPSVCTNTPFKFKVSLPYCADSIRWNLNNLPGPPAAPATSIYTTCTPGPGGPDSTTVVNGKTIYWYSLPTFYSFSIIGTYPVTITTFFPTAECGGTQDIDFDLQISNPPLPSYSVVAPGCYMEAAQFIETTPQTPKATYKWYWDFGDGFTSTSKNPTHIYAAPGTYITRYASITTPGCLSDTITQTITIPDVPSATINGATAVCINTAAPTITFTASQGRAPYQFSYHINAGPALTVNSTGTGNTATITAPTGVAGTFIYTLDSVKNVGSTLCTKTLTGQAVTITINPDAAIALTSAPATSNQTLCINNAITDITYAITGGGTGATVTGLPAGVTGTFTAGVFTITGTPTVSGTFNYTITTSGTCVQKTASGTILVNPDAAITLTSPIGSNIQSLCINTLISNISYTISGGGAGAIVAGLPPGVGSTYSSGTITLSGAPTLAGTYNYTITTTGTCVQAVATGTITVNPDAAIALTSAPATANQTLCINNAIANITYAVTGGGTGATITGLPAGVTGVYAAGNVLISGTPTVSGSFTYTVTTTGTCVQKIATGTILVNPDAAIALTSAPATTNQTLCINTNIATILYSITGGGTGATITGLPAGVTGTYAGGTFTINGAPSVTGTFNYTITTTGICIQKTATGTIIVNPDAAIALTSAPATTNQTLCINNAIANITYAVTGGGTGATVTGLPTGVTGTYAAGVVTITGAPTVTGSFTYTVTTTGTCIQKTATGTILVNPDAAIALTSAVATTNQELCNNATLVNITYAITGGGSGATVTGLPAGVTGTYAGGIFTIAGTPTANGTFNYTVTTTGICVQKTATGTIIVNALPTPGFTFSNPDCENKTVVFTDASIPNSGTIANLQWTFGDATIGTGTPVNHTYTNAGVYTVGLIVTTSKGCSNPVPFTKPVTVSVNPLSGFIVPEVCINDIAAVFIDTSKISTGTITNWYWDFGDPVSGALNFATTKNGTHLYTNTGLYTVKHIAYSSTGCSDTATQNIFINGANPTANFIVNNPTTLCANDSVAITNTSVVSPGNVTKVEIYWDFINNPGAVVIDDNPFPGKIYRHLYPNFQTPLTKTFAVRFIAYSGSLCFNEKTTNITVNAAPKVQFNAMPDVCYDAAPFQITQASEIGGVPGLPPVYSGPGVSPSGIFSPAVAGIGTHYIKYTFTSSAGGCVDTLTRPITVIDTASAKFTVVTPTCEGGLTTFKEASTAPAGVTLNNTVWNFGDGTPLENHAPGSTFTHSFAAAGTYTVKMYNTSAYGCKSTVRSMNVIISPIPNTLFKFNETSVCLPGASVSFVNQSTIADGSESGFTYLWNFGDIGSGFLNTSFAKTPPPHVYPTVGPYTVNLTVTSDSGCVKAFSKLVDFIHPQPKAAFTMSKTGVCIGDPVTFNDITNGLDGTVNQWFWNFGDASTGSTKLVSHQYADTLVYNVSLYIINSKGCNSDTLTQQFTVYPYPVFDAGPDVIVLEGGSTTLNPNIIRGTGLQYLWMPATYLNDNTLQMPTASNMLDDITYTLQVTGRGGCIAPTDKMFVKVLKAPKVPNTFTPNGDGINETWKIEYLDTYPNCKVQIFTRTGQLVFESRGYKTPWDGTIKGKPLPFDTYYYIIEPENGRKPITGYVTIVK